MFKKILKLEGLDRECRPGPFKTMFLHSIFSFIFVERILMDSSYILWKNLKITSLDSFQ